MASDTEPGTPVFAPEGAKAREELRTALHESAVAMRMDRLGVVKGEINTAKYDLPERIAELGFKGEAKNVFDLLPLVHVAWADGKIQGDERLTILRLLQVRNVPLEAFTVMEALLESRPSDEYLEESLETLKELLDDKPEQAKTVVGLCILVAEAAGGILGMFNPISKEERATIEKIAAGLGDAAVAEFVARLGKK